MKNFVNQLKEKQNKLFLIDSLGAFLTSFLLYVVLRNVNEYIGIPKTILTYLALIAFFFCIYSAACFFFLKQHKTLFIWGIGIANLLYCILIIGVLIVNYPFVTTIGFSYFLIEIAIICVLVSIEFKVATAVKRHRIQIDR